MSNHSKIAINKAKAVFGIKSSTQNYNHIKKWIGLSLKVTLAGAATFFIASKVAGRTDALSLIASKFESTTLLEAFLYFIVPSSLCMTLNWWLEVIKWKSLLHQEVSISWRTAIKGVLSGTTIGVFSPNRIGEFLGRVLALSPQHRVSGSLLSLVNGVAQSIATYTFGMVGLLFLIEHFALESLGLVGSRVLQILLILSVPALLLVYHNFSSLATWLSAQKLLIRYKSRLSIYDRVESATLWKIYHLSLLRFATFIVQYFIVFAFIMHSPNQTAVIAASVLTLFSSTVIPFLPIPDLLLREALAMSYFDLFHFDLGMVSIGVFLVWFINVGLPALLGSMFLFTYRIFKTK